jgi:hypothetical protein
MPYHYLSMNHNRAWRISVAAIVLFWILEYALILAFNRTLCTKFYSYYLHTFLGFTVKAETMRSKPQTGMTHLSLVLVPRLVSFLGQRWKKVVLRLKKSHNIQVGPEHKIKRPQEKAFGLEQNSNKNNKELTFNQFIVTPQGNKDSFGISKMNNKSNKRKNRWKDYIHSDVKDSTKEVDQNDILNLVPRRQIELNNWILSSELDKTIQIKTPKPTRKPKVLKTDMALLLITLALIIALYTHFINDRNNAAIWIHILIARLFFHILPHYWVLRSDDRINFIQRRFNRFYGD